MQFPNNAGAQYEIFVSKGHKNILHSPKREIKISSDKTVPKLMYIQIFMKYLFAKIHTTCSISDSTCPTKLHWQKSNHFP